MKVPVFNIIFFLLPFFIPLHLKGQSVIEGSVVIYNFSFEPEGVNIIVIDTISSGKVIGTVADPSGTFRMNSVPNGKIDLEFSFVGCYKTLIKGIELNNDTIHIENIPVFEGDCEIAWDGYCEKKILWGLIKKTEACGGTDYYKSPFPDNNRIYMDCESSGSDSILFEVEPKTKIIEVDYETIKACGKIAYEK